MAVSSYCKSCGAYLSFRKGGEIVARPQATPDPFAHRPPQPKVDIEYKAREERKPAKPKAYSSPEPKEEIPPPVGSKHQDSPAPGTKSPAPKPAVSRPDSEETLAEDSPHSPPGEKEKGPSVSSAPATPPEGTKTVPLEVETGKLGDDSGKSGEPDRETAVSGNQPEVEARTEPEDTPSRYQGKKEEVSPSRRKKVEDKRLAACFECGDSHMANLHANSTQCRKCGRLISLEDQHIRTTWSSRIQTRGDVFIHKKGIVLGASIQCHNLIVEGDFTGSAECSGDLTLRRHGKIIGKVICDRLLVEKRAKVEFLNVVETNECRIDGLVTGNLACRGRLSLEKKATLTGNIKVGSLVVADGAKHTGQIQMGGF